MSWKIPLFKIYTDDNDVQKVTEIIKSGMNWATGSSVNLLEDKIATYVGSKYAVTFNSGTSALHAALASHRIPKGSEVIVPSFTFIATANSPKFLGATPVFADIEESTYGLSPEDVLDKITPKTSAIMPVHIGGCPCKIKELQQIAEDKKILLIEDAAESLGARIGNKKVGTFGDSAMFSFCAPKVITTGEGGVIVTDSRDVYERLKMFRSHGRADTKDYFSTNEYLDYISLGYNFRMSNIIAALGIAQMDKIDKIIEMRRKNADYLSGKLKKVTEIKTPLAPKNYYHLYQMYTIEAKHRDELMNFLGDAGIMAKVYFHPVHLSHYYKEVLKVRPHIPVTEHVASKVLTLPMYPGLTIEEMDYMVDKITEFYERRQ
ncbi:DegT/DnrJ/EryC1/StrS family aminotransferase [Methanoregula sp.]|uniref:DegT/DnrJ/EryC1/StrS family aminotransferase n=1 Tax=Methanoregula sp. TaxID=2052170 RepID=UPI003C7184EF